MSYEFQKTFLSMFGVYLIMRLMCHNATLMLHNTTRRYNLLVSLDLSVFDYATPCCKMLQQGAVEMLQCAVPELHPLKPSKNIGERCSRKAAGVQSKHCTCLS